MWKMDHTGHWGQLPTWPGPLGDAINKAMVERFRPMENVIDEIYAKMPTKRMKP